MNDGNNCDINTECIDDYCGGIYSTWVHSSLSGVPAVNYSVFCNEWISNANKLYDNDGWNSILGDINIWDPKVCEAVICAADWNVDGCNGTPSYGKCRKSKYQYCSTSVGWFYSIFCWGGCGKVLFYSLGHSGIS